MTEIKATDLIAVAHPAVRVVAEILSARLDMERWERDGWPTIDDDLAAAVAPAFLHWIAGQFEARAKRHATGGGHPAHLTTVASGWYSAAAVAGVWADEIEDALDAEAAQRELADPAPSVPLAAVMTDPLDLSPSSPVVTAVAAALRTHYGNGPYNIVPVGGAAYAAIDAAASSAAHLDTLRDLHESRRLADMRQRVIALHREEITAAGRVVDAVLVRALRGLTLPGEVMDVTAPLAEAPAAFDAPAGRTGPLYCGAVGEHIDNPAPTKEARHDR